MHQRVIQYHVFPDMLIIRDILLKSFLQRIIKSEHLDHHVKVFQEPLCFRRGHSGTNHHKPRFIRVIYIRGLFREEPAVSAVEICWIVHDLFMICRHFQSLLFPFSLDVIETGTGHGIGGNISTFKFIPKLKLSQGRKI